MFKGLYTAASGMMLQMVRQDIIANNVANINTGGYKKDMAVCQSFPEILVSRLGDSKIVGRGREKILPPVTIGSLSTGAAVAGIITDHGQGTFKNTAIPTDLAISEEGYFCIATPQGERFTRDGSFKINEQGILVSNQGFPVMDINNNHIPVSRDLVLDQEGNIVTEDNIETRLKIVNFAEPRSLKKEGAWMNSEGQNYLIVERPGILQGYQELSNVNAVEEMTRLISVVRAYETCQKIIQAEDETIQIAIDRVGAIR